MRAPISTVGRVGHAATGYAVAIVGLWLLLLAPHEASAAEAPVNDNCLGALVIPGAGPFPYPTPTVDITSATTNGETLVTNTCQPDISRGVWYSFTPSQTGVYTVSTCSPLTTVDDTVLGIFTSVAGCNGPFKQVACDDDFCNPNGGPSQITIQLFADTTYYIVVWQYDVIAPAPGKGIIEVVVSKESVAPNDTCDTAIPVMLNVPVSGSTAGAVNNYRLADSNACFTGIGQTSSSASGRDVVYTFTAPATDSYLIKAANYGTAAGFNLVLYVAGYCPPGVGPQTVNNCLAAANRNPASSAEEVTCLTLTNGQLVYIYIDDNSTNSGSSFTLTVTRCRWEVEPNDLPGNASPLAAGTSGVINTPGDVDFFSLGDFPAGWRAFVLVDGEAANIPDFQLRITTWTNTLEFDDNDNDTTFGQSSPNIAGTPLLGGPVFASVNYNGAVAAGPYRIYGVVQPPLAQAAVETEPNDLRTQANTDDRAYFYGSLSGPAPSADVDVFSFFASDGDLIFVSLDEDPLRNNTPVNAQMELLDGFGNVLLTVNDINALSNTNDPVDSLVGDNPKSPAEALVYRSPGEDTYYVRVRIGTSSSGSSGAGDYLLSISKNGFIGGAGGNHAPVLSNVSVSSPIIENGLATLSGAVTDPDTVDALDFDITWGDGTSNRVHSAPGVFQFNFNHSYLDDGAKGSPSANYPVHVSVTDSSGASDSAGAAVVVNNAPPALSNIVVTTPLLSGAIAALTGNIIDPGHLDSFVLTVNWGDGSAPQMFNYSAGATAFSETHPFIVGPTNLTIQLAIADDDTGIGLTNVPIQIRAQPTAAEFAGISQLENGSMLLQIKGTPYGTYRVETSIDLINWSELGVRTADAAGNFSIEDGAPLPASRFYRAVVVE